MELIFSSLSAWHAICVKPLKCGQLRLSRRLGPLESIDAQNKRATFYYDLEDSSPHSSLPSVLGVAVDGGQGRLLSSLKLTLAYMAQELRTRHELKACFCAEVSVRNEILQPRTT